MSEAVGQHSPDTVQRDGTPTAKVTAGTLSGAFATVLLFTAESVGVEMTAGQGAAFVTVAGFLAAYWKKSRPGDNDR